MNNLREQFLKNRYNLKIRNYSLFINNYNLFEDTFNKIINAYTNSLNINLYVSYYKDCNELRCKELDLCLKINCNNKLFNKIIIINETEQPIEFINNLDERIIVINNKKRQTFYEFFNIANQYSDENTINILCNSDMIIGENFDKINLKNDEIFFLERYEVDSMINYSKSNSYGSDTWIWKGLFNSKLEIGKYFMGVPCCDYKLTYEFYKNNYKLKNPSVDLKTYHIHITNIRNFTVKDTLQSELFIKVKPSQLDSKFDENEYIIFK